jgi:hypothetical protein
LLTDAITLNPLKIENLGVISIPVSVQVLTVYFRHTTRKFFLIIEIEQDIKKLKEISEVACYGKQLNKILDSSKQLALEINSSKLTSTISDDKKVKSSN